jgi:FAD/FMN-containing dehydrogenase
MTTVNSSADVDGAVRALRPHLGERLLLTGDSRFPDARRVWNAAVTRHPAAIARCRDAAEVSLAVRAARDNGVPLSVRAGGHDWAGRALREGGLVVDLTLMRGVAVDVAARTATIQGGATAADLLGAAAPHGLATATGVVGSVGMAGLTTVGGYGPLTGHCGLALDNLIDADVVLADGSTVTPGPAGDTELWWALRGGGGNFGVVTRVRYRLHDIPVVLTGMLMFPPAEAGTILAGYAEIVADAPDDLTVLTGFLPGPQGQPVPFLCPFWCGADLAEGERAVARLRSLGHPVVDHVAAMPLAAALGLFDANIVDGNHYLLRSRSIADVSAGADALIAGAAGVTSPFSTLFVNHLHGAAARVDPAATAFANRVPHHVVEVIAAWPPGDTADRHRDWADSVARGLDPVALVGGYPNVLGPDDDERARDSYGDNLARLLAAKRRYDPDNAFSAIPALIG